MVTDTINPEGTVGTVGNIGVKTEVVLDYGAKILLVVAEQEFNSNRILVQVSLTLMTL